MIKKKSKFRSVEHIRKKEHIRPGWILATEFYLPVLRGSPPGSLSYFQGQPIKPWESDRKFLNHSLPIVLPFLPVIHIFPTDSVFPAAS